MLKKQTIMRIACFTLASIMMFLSTAPFFSPVMPQAEELTMTSYPVPPPKSDETRDQTVVFKDKDGNYDCVHGLLELLPDIEWDASSASVDVFMDFVETAFFFLPVSSILTILALVISVNFFKVGVSLLKTIWQVLPFT